MAKENVIKFYEQLKADKASAEALKKAVADASVEATLAFARERGFEFTLDDVKAANADAAQELSPEELDAVAAGFFCLIIGGSRNGVMATATMKGIGACAYIGIGYGNSDA